VTEVDAKRVNSYVHITCGVRAEDLKEGTKISVRQGMSKCTDLWLPHDRDSARSTVSLLKLYFVLGDARLDESPGDEARRSSS